MYGDRIAGGATTLKFPIQTWQQSLDIRLMCSNPSHRLGHETMSMKLVMSSKNASDKETARATWSLLAATQKAALKWCPRI